MPDENDGGTSDASAALRKIIAEINAKFNEKEVEQKLSMVYQEWGDPNHLQSEEFLVLCNTFSTVGYVFCLLANSIENNQSITSNFSASPVYNETECIYLKNLIEKIVISESHTIPLMTAIYLSSQPATHSQSTQSTSKKITKQRAEDLLEEFAMSGYIFLTAGGSVTLGPRAIGEFRDVLRTKFGDHIQSCRLCNEIVLQVILKYKILKGFYWKFSNLIEFH